MTGDGVLRLLMDRQGSYLSGEEIAAALSVSRTAVWKAVEQLRQEGYRIDSVTKRGYCLTESGDRLNAERIRAYLSREAAEKLEIRTYPSITSTNTVLKAMAEEGAPEGLCLAASEQTAGRGRRGRSFWSPPDTGLYMSLLLRPSSGAADATAMTSAAAVAVCEALESLAPIRAEIKWVNDVFVEGRKVCGILTEASLDCESGQVNYQIIGIGINTRPPMGDFPEELQGVAGSVFGDRAIPELRCRLAAAVLERLLKFAEHAEERPWYGAYRERSLVLGKQILILAPGREPEPAEAVGLDRDFGLLVRTETGELRKLNAGEVSIRGTGITSGG